MSSWSSFTSRVRLWFAIGVAAVFGCNGSNDTSHDNASELPFRDVVVTFAVPAGFELKRQWSPAVNDWAEENFATADIVELPYSTNHDDWLDHLQGASPALILLPTDLIGELVGAGLVAPIPQDVIDAEVIAWQQVPPGIRATFGMLGDVPAIVPVTCPTPVLGFRADLLEAAGRQPPETWPEYDLLVREINQWAPGLHAVEPWSDQSLPTVFFARAISGAKHPAQYSVEIDAIDGEPLIASAPFLSALDEMRVLAPFLAPGVRSMNPEECRRELVDGSAAIGIFWLTPQFPDVDETEPSAAAADSKRGPLAMTPLPGRSKVYDHDAQEWSPPPASGINRPALSGFAGFSVCTLASASNIERSAAWDLWGLLEGYLSDGTVPSLPGMHVSASDMDSGALIPGFTAGERQQYQQAARMSLQSPLLVCELPMLGRSRFREDLQAALCSTLDGQTSPDAALSDVQRRWSATIESLGRERVISSYRQRHGLSPLTE